MKEKTKASISLISFLRFLTPCVMGILFCLYALVVAITDSEKARGWSALTFVIVLPALFVLAGLDFLLKRLFGNSLLVVWIVELAVLAGFFWLYGNLWD